MPAHGSQVTPPPRPVPHLNEPEVALAFIHKRRRRDCSWLHLKTMAEQTRTCALCGNKASSMHFLPKTEDGRKSWLEFIYGTSPPASYSKTLVLCSTHFKDSDFMNFGEYSRGFASKLILRPGSVPSRRSTISPQADTGGTSSHILRDVRHVASQTLSLEELLQPPRKRSVGTQLSMKTLHNHFRSTATQVKVSSKDCGVCTLTFPLDSPLLFLQPTMVKRPSKRRRLSLTEEDQGPSESSTSVVAQEPEGST